MRDIGDDVGERVIPVAETYTLATLVDAMASDVDTADDEIIGRVAAGLEKHGGEAMRNVMPAPQLLRLVSSIAYAVRLALARGVRLILTETPGATEDEIARVTLGYVTTCFRRLRGLEREPLIAFAVAVSKVYAHRCRQYPDPASWFAETKRYADGGGWATRRR